MNMKRVHYLLLAYLMVVQSGVICAKTLEFLNKLDMPIEVAIGTRTNPPTMSSKTTQVMPGQSYKQSVDNTQFPQLLFKDPKAPEIAFVYEFRDKTDAKKALSTNMYVRVLEKKGFLEKEGRISFEPQTFVMANLDKENIFLVKTLGNPAPAKITAYTILGLQEGASDAAILGLKKEELNDKTAAQKAYFKLLAIWHPDKNNDEETIAQRNTNITFKNLTEKRQNEMVAEVFKLITDAYSRITKAMKK